MKLNWNGRASQAPFIPESEWAQHKSTICSLRLVRTLESLMIVMSRDHNFTASQPQYKSRFQKWHLPHLRTLALSQEANVPPPDTSRNQPPELLLPMALVGQLSGTATAGSAPAARSGLTVLVVVEPRVFPQASFVIGSNWEWDLAVGESHAERKPGAPEPEVSDLPPGNSAALPIPEPWCRPEMRRQRSLHSGFGELVSPQMLLSGKDCNNIVAMLTSRDLQNIGEAAHFLFALGSYQIAHDLYFLLWRALLARRSVPMSLLVSAIGNIARSSFQSAQLVEAKLAVDTLIKEIEGRISNADPGDCLMPLPMAELTLRVQQEKLLRKLNQPSHAVERCECAYHAFCYHGYDSGNAPRDYRAVSFLPHRCGMEISNRYRRFAVNHKSSCNYLLNRDTCLERDSNYAAAIPLIFNWCADRSLDEALEQRVSDAFAAETLVYQPDYESIESFFRGIGTLVFCHVWTTYANASIPIQTGDVPENVAAAIRTLEGISSPEIFATICFEIVGPVVLRNARKRSLDFQARNHLSTPLYVAQLLRHVQESALNLVHSSQSGFIGAILKAYASINTAQPLSEGTTNSEYFSVFTEKYSAISLSFSLSQALAAAPKDNKKPASFMTSDANLPSVAFDPFFSLTPRASQSSGFASMLSLRQEIAGRKAEGLLSGGSLAADQTRSSWSSGSLRRQQRLSTASYRTLSTEYSESLHGSAMEWVPAFSTIEELMAI